MGEKPVSRTPSGVDDFKTIFKIVKNLTPTYMIERRTKRVFVTCVMSISLKFIVGNPTIGLDNRAKASSNGLYLPLLSISTSLHQEIRSSSNPLISKSKAKEFRNTKGKQITITISSLEYVLSKV